MESNNNCTRIEAGKKIFENPNVQILRLNGHHYTVKSQTSKRKYDVISMESGWHVPVQITHSGKFVVSTSTE